MNINNSSAEELLGLVKSLGNNYTERDGSLLNASDLSKEIGNIFYNANGALSKGWNEVGMFLGNIAKEIDQDMRMLEEGIVRFSEQTIQNETNIINAVNTANDKASEILNSLNINAN